MGATNVLASGTSCLIIRQIRAPVAQILDQRLQAIGVLRLWTICLEQHQGLIELASPEVVRGVGPALPSSPPSHAQSGWSVRSISYRGDTGPKSVHCLASGRSGF